MVGPVAVRGESKAVARERADRLLDRVGVTDKAHAHPIQRSGGQSSGWRSRGRWRWSQC